MKKKILATLDFFGFKDKREIEFPPPEILSIPLLNPYPGKSGSEVPLNFVDVRFRLFDLRGDEAIYYLADQWRLEHVGEMLSKYRR